MLILQRKFLFMASFLKKDAPNYFRFLTIPYWKCAKRFSYVGITDGM